MKQKKWLAILVMLILACSGIVSTAAAPTNPTEFITCNIDGIATNNKFSKIDFTVNGITNTNGYAYAGVDIGVFQKPIDYDTKLLNADWKAVSVERVFSNSLNFVVNDFGDYSKYQQDQVYVLGYRVLYLEASSQQNLIIESPWRRVDDSTSNNDYFKYLDGNNQVVLTDRVTNANNWLDDAVSSGKITETKAEELNKYVPDSEVVCKLIIIPKGMTDKYTINMDLNDNNKLNIDYIKVTKVLIGEDTISSETTPYKEELNKNKTTFDINSPRNKTVTIYFKYKFSKKDKTKPLIDALSFNNDVSIQAFSGNKVDIMQSQNIIRVRDASISYR